MQVESMKVIKLLLATISLVMVVALFQTKAHAQGCGQAVIDESFDCCGSPSTTSTCGGSSGNPGNFCFQGHGECCGVGFDTASTAPDESCSCNFLSQPRLKSKTQFIGSFCGTAKPKQVSVRRYHPRVFIASGCNPGFHPGEAVIAPMPPRIAYVFRDNTGLEDWQ